MRRQDVALLAAVLALAVLVLMCVTRTRPEAGSPGLADRPMAPAEEAASAVAPPSDAGRAGALAGAPPPAAEATAETAAAAVPGGPPPTETAASASAAGARRIPDPGEATGTARILLSFVDPDGDPVADAQVTLHSPQVSRQATSDGGGRALFAALPSGAYAWEVRTPDRPELSSPTPIALGAGQERELTVRLGRHDLAIAGRVLDPAGDVLAGIEILASASGTSPRAPVVVAARADLRTRSASDGAYRITGLGEGEYQVRTVETPHHPSASLHVRAGVDGADLVVAVRRLLRVHGSVRDSRGSALEAVEVRPVGAPPVETRSGADGRYSLDVDVSQPERVHSMQFAKPGFEEQRVELPRETLGTLLELEVDAVLEAEGGTVRVEGLLQSTDGRAVPGERIELFATGQGPQYRAVSDARGHFSFDAVRTGTSYRVRVWPEGPYKDHAGELAALDRDETALEISLEPLDTADVSGRFVDAQGSPISSFEMWLRPRTATARHQRVWSDGLGRFRVDGVPAGDLVFETRSSPYLRSEGYRVEEGEASELAPVVLDWGEHEVAGRILDAHGEPVSGVQVRLDWSQSGAGARHTSTRLIQTDGSGAFRFTRVGAGVHRLSVRHAEFPALERSVDVGDSAPELELRLSRGAAAP